VPASEASGPAGARSVPLSTSRRAWGWHPLVDEWAARVVADASIRSGELVVDLGAGTGALTRHLLLAGARVLAVELHPGRVRALRERCPAATVIEVDARDFRWPMRPFRVVASPPYALSSALIRTLLARHSHLVAADIVLQRAAVRRFVEAAARSGARSGAPSGARSRAASSAPPGGSTRWLVQQGLSMPRRAFRPPPQVDSAVLVVRRRR
jgi:23S rRNA (adenine-N6)-dimethyltransferase